MPSNKIQTQPVTIGSSGDTTTPEIDLQNRVLVGVQMPASIASSTMKIAGAQAKGGTFVNVQDGLAQYGVAGDVTFTIAASKYLAIPPAITAGLPVCKLVFGSSETSKTFEVFTREI